MYMELMVPRNSLNADQYTDPLLLFHFINIPIFPYGIGRHDSLPLPVSTYSLLNLVQSLREFTNLVHLPYCMATLTYSGTL